MKSLVCAALALCLWIAQGAGAASLREETAVFGPFGTVHIYRGSAQPQQMMLFVSGDGGWDDNAVAMARELARVDSIVVGIDITAYIKKADGAAGQCNYAAAQFEALSQYLQKKFQRDRYRPPVLVGYSAGATLVYAVLAQAPPNTFAGALSLGFCPDLQTAKPLCRGSGSLSWGFDNKTRSYLYRTVPRLPAPWYVLQGDSDEVCNAPDTLRFAGRVGNATALALPKVGHGFSVSKNWLPQFKDAFDAIVAAQTNAEPAPVAAAVNDLPLVELPAAAPTALAVIVSGDGGWAGIDRQLGESLQRSGTAVVGLDSLQYFWSKKTPAIAAADLARIIAHYSATWGTQRVLLIGYSRGADVLPFMINRLPPAIRAQVTRVALLGPDSTISFEFRLSDWLGNGAHADALAVLPEVQQLKNSAVLCIYGAAEHDSLCRGLDKKSFDVVELTGGHHFGGDYQELARIIQEARR
jgi:type IV secretory pathway VirJ component